MMTTSTDTTGSATADAVSAPLDLLLTEAAFGALNRLNPGGSGLRLAAALAFKPRLVAGRSRQLLGEMARIAVGTSQVQPSRRDRRFADPGWAGNPLLRRAFEVGVDLAVTPGSVVLRTPVFELIQYRPSTAMVRQVPLLIVPPTINKFYLIDLAPGRSMAEYLIGQGLQVFIISWRNPDARHAKWGFDTYGQAILDAMDAVARITRTERTALMGCCSGGILSSMVAAHLAHTGRQDQIAAFSLMVTVLDQARAGLSSALASERNARLAAAVSQARGYLDGRSLAEMFAWLRPNDLIWNYWVNNYLLGRKPPPFDILFWNADTTRMTAALHRDFLQMGVTNGLTRPGGVTMLGSPVDLAAVDRDTYLVAGITDHLCPWQSCYRSTQLLSGSKRFVLSTSGHIAAMVNPPGNEKARYQVAKESPEDPQEWLRRAQNCHGTWWPDYASWLAEHCGEETAAPEELGGGGLEPIGDAPGTYVYDR